MHSGFDRLCSRGGGGYDFAYAEDAMRTTLLLIVLAAAGCHVATAAPSPAKTVGQWQGTVQTRTTQRKEAIHEEFTVTILPTGRFLSIGLIDGDSVVRVGQVVRIAGQPAARVLAAHYDAVSSQAAVEYLGVKDSAGRPIRTGASVQAELLTDGCLRYRMFTWSISPEDATQCDAVMQSGVLTRRP